VDPQRPIAVQFVRMASEIQERLDYPSKLTRQPAHIERLLAHGRLAGGAVVEKVEPLAPRT
jgi:hypothetical protein